MAHEPQAGQNTVKNTDGLRPPWQPGESGNPGGRPRRKLLTDAYAAMLAKPIPNDKEGRTFAEAIAQALLKEALKGKVNAASELADRVEGKVTRTVSGPDGEAIQVRTLSDFYADNVREMTDAELEATISQNR